jgi:hypothetical protein
MYFIYNEKYGSSSSVGSPSIYNNWYFPEGCTGPGYDQWMLVYNPNDKNTNVLFKFFNAQGAYIGNQTITVPAGRRATLKANNVPGVDNNWEVWTNIQSDLPIVAERSIYIDSGDKSGGTNSKGIIGGASNVW